jgi:O-methyltransferase
MSFYGPPQNELGSVVHHLSEAVTAYQKHGLSYWAADNCVALNRRTQFMRDKQFGAAFAKHSAKGDEPKMWRIATYCWAIRTAFGVAGDLVECGVFEGLYAGTAFDYLDLDASGRTFYLYDTFVGLVEKYSSSSELMINGSYAHPYYEIVQKRFASHPSARIVPGMVPDVLYQTAPEKVAFLHLDMNAAAAEAAAAAFFWQRMPKGGVILADDYGRAEHQVGDRLDIWASSVGHTFLEMPTGQGLLIKTCD